MGAEVSIWTPFPPSVNGLFAHGLVRGKVRRFPTKAYKQWRREAVLRMRLARIPTYDVPVVVKLELTPRDSRPRDADNYAKGVMDALVEARILTDDSNRYVKSVTPYWMPPSKQAGCTVFIRPAENIGTPADRKSVV